jgi:hypothetical protein
MGPTPVGLRAWRATPFTGASLIAAINSIVGGTWREAR